MNDAVIQWLDSALMDLRNIEKIMEDSFLTPIACFHAQQCIEKTLKAALEGCQCNIPKTHDLVRLYGLLPSKEIIIDVEMNQLQTISDLYIETRYPGDAGMMPDGKPTIRDVMEFYGFAKKISVEFKDVLCRGENR